MFYVFFSMALLFCVLCYMNLDPMKSSFFLIFSLLCSMPLLSVGMNIWYSYFVCLLFLSGIFVILVYFSSLSKISFVKSKGVVFIMVLSFLVFSPTTVFLSGSLSLNSFYYSIFWFQLVFLMLVLLLFMNFSSYFLNFSGALRKV